jgi:pimeloyl-ACP methyl ester carboxylesterase
MGAEMAIDFTLEHPEMVKWLVIVSGTPRRFEMQGEPPEDSRLAEIGIPTLIIAGALEHPEILRAVDLLANGIKGTQKIILVNTVHVLNMKKPAEFNRFVLDFLSLI